MSVQFECDDGTVVMFLKRGLPMEIHTRCLDEAVCQGFALK